jgi:hypothetical protein
MDLACLDGVGPIVNHHIVIVADVRQAATHKLTINVPVVFMARYKMVLRGATSLHGALEGVGLKIETFLGPEMARAKRVPFGPKKVKLLQQTWSYTSKLSSFCNKHGLTRQDFKLFQQTWSNTVKLSSFCNKHGLAQSSFQALATKMVLHT